MTHGVFATSSHPIGAGDFAEDPAEIQAYIDGILDGLAPRDNAERAQAQFVANAYLREQRLVRLEATVLASAGSVPPSEQRRLVEERREVQEYWDGCEDLRRALTGLDHDPDCQKLVRFIEKRQSAARDAIERLWRDGLPDTLEDWSDALKALIREVWGPDDSGGIEWIEREQTAASHELGVLEGRALGNGAERGLQVVDRVTVYSMRISLVLERALREYHRLQARPLAPPASPPRRTSSPKRVISVEEISARETNPTLEGPPAT